MLDVCSSFADEVDLQISTDPNLVKNQSKAVYVIGPKTGLEMPAPLLPSGKALPYVAHATHLGNELQEDGTMSMGTTMRRGAFIGKTLEVQEAFRFAAPAKVLGALKLHCEDLYGDMLVGLDSAPAGQLMNCWAKTVEDVWHRQLTASTPGG